MTAGRVLVAGIGNVFLGDDGFGPAVVERVQRDRLPAAVDVADFGIAGVHLAYELLDGRYGCVVLVDAVPMGERPGTLAVLEADAGEPGSPAARVDAHSMAPTSVLSTLAALGGTVERVLVVGCEPCSLDLGMSLSEPVGAVLERAARLVEEVANGEAKAIRPVAAVGPAEPGEP